MLTERSTKHTLKYLGTSVWRKTRTATERTHHRAQEPHDCNEHGAGGEGCGEESCCKREVVLRWQGQGQTSMSFLPERLQGKKRQRQKFVAYTEWGMLIGLTITNTRGGLCSQCDCFNPYYSPIWKVLLSSWLLRPGIWGQRDDEIVEEYPVYQLIMELGEKAGNLAPGLYPQWLYLLPLRNIQRRVLRDKI